jgi:transposase
MMGRLNHDQDQFFYSFRLDEAVPGDHPVRAIAGVLDLSWAHSELAAHYSKLGRPSIDPVLMIRMLLVGYAFAIRSERMLCREIKVNLAYRWFCGLSIGTRYRITRRSLVPAMNGSVTAISFAMFLRVSLRPVSRPGWSEEKGLRSMPA